MIFPTKQESSNEHRVTQKFEISPSGFSVNCATERHGAIYFCITVELHSYAKKKALLWSSTTELHSNAKKSHNCGAPQ